MRALIFLLALMFAASAGAQVATRDCQSSACSFISDAYPPGEQPVSCRLYNGGTVILAETPALMYVPTGTFYCSFSNVTLPWGTYQLTARGIGSMGQLSAHSNTLNLVSAAPPPPPTLIPPPNFRMI